MEKNEEIRLRFFSLGERENGKHCRISMSVSKWRDFSTPLTLDKFSPRQGTGGLKTWSNWGING
ncbi:hypothetical protein HMPREF0322_04984 [Desulfitobacterium hafniense DP7]|uniref:Uncharacterized protein n=1 Tax=Desulfitobacterium hafniense DP7 TaxID=537010 RepID=G9XVH1_DESHA|nr:hypothetical protein HMPREF0322_04984 [Desulfitobacterium hafniense DP7]